MDNPQQSQLLALVQLVYECGVSDDRWPDFFANYARATGSSYPVLFAQDTVLAGDGRPGIIAADCPAPWLQEYGGHYADRNIWFRGGVRHMRPGDVHTSDMVCTRSALLGSEYYNDFLKPKDILHAIGGTASREGNRASVLSAFRSHRQRPYGRDEVDLLRALLPHLGRALRLRGYTAELEARARWQQQALDSLEIGVLVAAGGAQVAFANREAERLLAEGDGLRTEQGSLRASTVALTSALRTLIHESSETSGGRSLSAGGRLAVGRPSERRPLDVAVMPAPGVGASAPGGFALVFVADPDRAPGTVGEAMQRLYGLTPAEARVAERLADGLAPAEIADRTGTSIHTVRTHLKRLLAKTSTARQGELVSLILRSGAALVAESSSCAAGSRPAAGQGGASGEPTLK